MNKDKIHSVLNKTAAQMVSKSACPCEPNLTEADRENLAALKRTCDRLGGKIRTFARRDPGMSEKECIREFSCDHPNSDMVLAFSGRCMKR